MKDAEKISQYVQNDLLASTLAEAKTTNDLGASTLFCFRIAKCIGKKTGSMKAQTIQPYKEEYTGLCDTDIAVTVPRPVAEWCGFRPRDPVA